MDRGHTRLRAFAGGFPDAYLKIFDLTNGDYTYFKDDIVIPIEPFFGTMGVHPSGPEKPVIMPPGPFGGNMDTRHITKGSILYLPVQHCGMRTRRRATARSA